MIIPFLFGLCTNRALAWFNTPVQTSTLYMGGQPVAKMGTTTEYGYDVSSSDTFPHFYSALIVGGWIGLGFLWYPEQLKIEVYGTDPNGDILSGDRFGDRDVLVSPDDSSVEQTILKTIYDILVSSLPIGLEEVVKNTISTGGATHDKDDTKAWGEWMRPIYGSCNKEKGLRFRHALVVDPDLEGTYTINIHYHTWICALGADGIVHHAGELDLYDTVEYTYAIVPQAPPDIPSRPSGCPSGYTYTNYTFYTSTTDPNGDDVRYEFDWGDGSRTTTDWTALGVTATASHFWSSLGTYNVRVRAQDHYSSWGVFSPSLPVSIENLYLTVLAEDQDGNSVTTDVYIDNELAGYTGSAFMMGIDQSIDEPIDDSFVDKAEPDKAMGTDSMNYDCLKVGGWSDSWRRIWIKFDLSTLPSTVATATLKLYCYAIGGFAADSFYAEAYYSSVDSWTEETITWNNQPSWSTYLGATYLSTDGWYSWDITSQVNSEYAGDQILTLVIKSPESGFLKSFFMASKEYVENPPKIEVTFPSTTVFVNDFESGGCEYSFNHWEDGSTSATRTMTITQNKTTTAYYDVSYHDVAVIDVAVLPPAGPLGVAISINMTVENRGTFIETFDASVYYTLYLDPLIGTQPVIDLLPSESRTLIFGEWTPDVAGRYKIRAEAPLPDDIDTADNTREVIVVVYNPSSLACHAGSKQGNPINGFHILGLFAMFGSVILLAFRKNGRMSLRNMPASILKENLRRNNLPKNTTTMWQDYIQKPT